MCLLKYLYKLLFQILVRKSHHHTTIYPYYHIVTLFNRGEGTMYKGAGPPFDLVSIYRPFTHL